jgi:hypothetical protein
MSQQFLFLCDLQNGGHIGYFSEDKTAALETKLILSTNFKLFHYE